MSTTDEPQDEHAGLANHEVRDEAAPATADDAPALATEPVEDEAQAPTSAADGGDEAPAEASPAEPPSAEDSPSEEDGAAADDAAIDPDSTSDPEPGGDGGVAAEESESAVSARGGEAVDRAGEPADAAAAAEPDAEEVAEPDAEEDVPAPALDRGLIEALLFAADEPLTPAQIKKVLGGVETSEVREVLEAIRAELDERKAGFALVEVAGGFQFRTRAEYGVWIRQLRSDKPPKLSKPALETLAVVSYKQPVTRAEIEAIRRVDTGAVLKTLLDRRLLKIVGTKDVPGRPALYGTSKEFLEVFRLKSLKELPTLKEIRDVAVEMGDALDVPRELLPEEVAAALPPLEEPRDVAPEQGAEPGEDGGEPEVDADEPGVHESPTITEEPQGSAEDEPAPSPPSAAAEED